MTYPESDKLIKALHQKLDALRSKVIRERDTLKTELGQCITANAELDEELAQCLDCCKEVGRLEDENQKLLETIEILKQVIDQGKVDKAVF